MSVTFPRRLPTRPTKLSALLLATAALVACSKPAATDEPVRAVKVMTVGASAFGTEPEFSAEVKPRVESRLGFRVAGKITRRQAEIGQLRELEGKWHADGQVNYRIAVAGAVEESSKGSSSIVAGVPIMLFLVFTLLMLQLHSFSRSLLVFITGPLGIAGVAGALLLLDRPFGFVAMLGVIALMGMIQRNAVILIDQIESDRRAGVQAWDAIVESAVRRLRPIVLTAAAAVLAMIPLSRSVFWGPMAVAIMGGLIVATVLTLLALPAMYAAAFRVKREPEAASVPV